MKEKIQKSEAQAKDFRIGNLVEQGYVVGITPRGLNIGYGISEPKFVMLHLIKPIPITEDMLIKFGFKKSPPNMSGCVPYKLGDWTLGFHNDGEIALWHRQISPPTWNLTTIRYVHELQNVFYYLMKSDLKYMSREIPEWWSQYKKANPTDTDDYDPNKHCCQRFWKDFCDCTKK